MSRRTPKKYADGRWRHDWNGTDHCWRCRITRSRTKVGHLWEDHFFRDGDRLPNDDGCVPAEDREEIQSRAAADRIRSQVEMEYGYTERAYAVLCLRLREELRWTTERISLYLQWEKNRVAKEMEKERRLRRDEAAWRGAAHRNLLQILRGLERLDVAQLTRAKAALGKNEDAKKAAEILDAAIAIASQRREGGDGGTTSGQAGVPEPRPKVG